MADLSRFPSNVLAPSTPYVYFLSLMQSENGRFILKEVGSFFANTPTSASNTSISTLNIDDAFSFLDHVIASEYNKERNYLEYLRTQTKDIKNFKMPTLDSDWTEFIKNIQEALSPSHSLQAAENELKRLQKQNERRGTKKNISQGYEQDQISKLTEYANMLNRFISKSTTGNTSKLGSQIYGMILSKFGNNLINITKAGTIEFNASQLLGLTNTITDLILHDYIIETSLDSQGKYKQQNDPYKNFDLKKLEEIVNRPETINRVNSFIETAHTLPWLSQDMAENLGLIKETSNEFLDSTKIQSLLNFINDTTNCQNRLEAIGDSFQQLFSEYTVPQSAFKITSTGNIFAEVVSIMNVIMDGAFNGINTGGAGAKPDNIIGHVTISIDELLAFKKAHPQQWNGVLKELEQIHSELKHLSNNLKSTNTQAYYQTQEQEWNQSVENIKKSLDNLYETYNLLGNCFIIEDSTKNYISLYGKTINNKLMDSLHGGSLGPNVSDQINKIAGLAAAGGISFPDAEWLIAVIINSGPGMVAQGQKNKLEQYLASFVTILLFDDQINLVKEAYKQIANSFPKTSVNKIHLFSVNDGYYPISYILQQTKAALQANYEAARAYTENPSGGAKAEISGYVKEPQTAYKNKKASNQWEATAQSAMSSTKISITFLSGFMGVLNKLFPTV